MAEQAFEVVLASASPRRRELLEKAGVAFIVRTPQTPVDETLEPDQLAEPAEACKKLAERKAGAVIQEVLAEDYQGMLIVIGADTMVVKDGEIFGKPRSLSDGKHMLRTLSGSTQPAEACKKLAERKAGAVIQEVLAEDYQGMLIVIGADTMVVKDGEIFGKPRSLSDGKHMLRTLSGSTHEVITAVSVWMVAAPEVENISLGFRTFHDVSRVTFRDLTDEHLAGVPHVPRREPRDFPRPHR